jgi:hypothetical protein
MSLERKFARTDRQTIFWLFQIYNSSMRSMGIKTRLSSPLKHIGQIRVKENDLFECPKSEKAWKEIAHLCEKGFSFNVHNLMSFISNPTARDISQDLKLEIKSLLKCVRKILYRYFK